MVVVTWLRLEMEWVKSCCRFAMVMWLSWIPGAQGLEGSTGEVVNWIVEEQYGDVVLMNPEEVDRRWCVSVMR